MDIGQFVAEYLPFLAAPEGGVVPAFIEYLSVVVGVLTGALFGCDRKLDIMGVTALGLVAGFGGGILRDVLLQDQGVYFTEHPYLILTCIAAGAVVFYFRGAFKRLDSTVFLADALSVGLFAAAGVSKALGCGSGFVMSVILGVVTAVGGGAVRDVCVGETPGIFKASNFYAIAALAGSLLYAALMALGLGAAPATVACVAGVVALRYLSVYFDWRTAGDPKDLTPYVSRPFKKAACVVRGLFLHGSLRSREHRRRRRWERR